MDKDKKELSLNEEVLNESAELIEETADSEYKETPVEKETADTSQKSSDKTEKENKTETPKKSNSLKSFFKSRKAKKGSVAILITVIFLALIIGLNFAANLLENRFPVLSADLTSKSVYELQSETIEYIQDLSKPVTIYVLSKESTFEAQGEYYVQANKLLHKFDQYSDNIELKYIDLASQPTFVSKYTNYDWKTSSYILLIESGDQYRALSSSDLFDYNQESYYYYGSYIIEGQHVEQAVVTAILNVTSEDKTKVSILSGQDEADSSALKMLLENNAYETEEISLLNANISEDSQFLIIYAPKVDIDDKSLETIRDWLNNNGEYGHNLIYFPNDQADKELPNIESLLNEWGITIEKGLVFETDPSHMTNTSNPYLITVMDYENDDYSKDLKTKELPVVMLYTMPVEITDKSMAAPLLTSSDKAVLMPFDADENWDYSKEKQTKYNGAAISTQTSDDKNSNVVVIGSYEAVGEAVLSSTSFNNSAYYLNIFNKLANKDNAGITIEGKNLDSGELGITSNVTAFIISIIVRFLIPAVILIIGLVVWLRRRNK